MAFLALTAVLAAALGATYALPVACPVRERQLTAGGILSFFAIGCPVCNKIALVLLGTSGALSVWAPIQPFVGAASLALLAVTVAWRVRQMNAGAACAA
jgi:hypothetical protein